MFTNAIRVIKVVDFNRLDYTRHKWETELEIILEWKPPNDSTRIERDSENDDKLEF